MAKLKEAWRNQQRVSRAPWNQGWERPGRGKGCLPGISVSELGGTTRPWGDACWGTAERKGQLQRNEEGFQGRKKWLSIVTSFLDRKGWKQHLGRENWAGVGKCDQQASSVASSSRAVPFSRLALIFQLHTGSDSNIPTIFIAFLFLSLNQLSQIFL